MTVLLAKLLGWATDHPGLLLGLAHALVGFLRQPLPLL